MPPPQSGLRQWVLTFPFPWRRRLAQDDALRGTVRRIERHLRRRGLVGIDEDGTGPDVPGDPESNLAASPGSALPEGTIALELAGRCAAFRYWFE